MKLIHDTLKGIQELQSYQLDRDRDRDILTPFFYARDYILQAQNATSLEARNTLLEKASDRMTTALNSVFTEMRTASIHLEKNTIELIINPTRRGVVDSSPWLFALFVFGLLRRFTGKVQNVAIINCERQIMLPDG